jgi:hypothetical protein
MADGEKKCIRLEIIMSQAIQDDFLTEVEFAVPGIFYTQTRDVMGRGHSVPKLGDAIWPQLNTRFVLHLGSADLDKVIAVVANLREHYKNEGLACFKSDSVEL